MNIYRCYSSAFVLLGQQFPVQLNAPYIPSPSKVPRLPVPPGFNFKRHFSNSKGHFSLSLLKFDDLVMSNHQAPHHSAHPTFKMLLHLFNETKMCTWNLHLNAACLTKLYICPEKTRKMGGSKGNMFTPMKLTQLKCLVTEKMHTAI